MNTGSN